MKEQISRYHSPLFFSSLVRRHRGYSGETLSEGNEGSGTRAPWTQIVRPISNGSSHDERTKIGTKD
jgi:hypothetical protein